MYHLLIARADHRSTAAGILHSLHRSGFTADDLQTEVATVTGAIRIAIRVLGTVERHSTTALVHQAGGLVARPSQPRRRQLMARVA